MKLNIFILILFTIVLIEKAYIKIQTKNFSQKSQSDLQIIQSFFSNKNFSDLRDENSHDEIKTNCHQFNLKRHHTLLKLKKFDQYSVLFLSENKRDQQNELVYVQLLETYSKIINETLESNINDYYIDEKTLKNIWEYNPGDSFRATWLSIEENNKCYHLLVELTPQAQFRLMLKRNNL